MLTIRGHSFDPLSQDGQRYLIYLHVAAPMQNTIADMWQMVWETNSNRIVMFAEIDKAGKVTMCLTLTYISSFYQLANLTLLWHSCISINIPIQEPF